jgi:hypothetical protein
MRAVIMPSASMRATSFSPCGDDKGFVFEAMLCATIFLSANHASSEDNNRGCCQLLQHQRIPEPIHAFDDGQTQVSDGRPWTSLDVQGRGGTPLAKVPRAGIEPAT